MPSRVTSENYLRKQQTFSRQMSHNSRKISPVQGMMVDSSQLTFVPTSKSRDTKTRPNIKNPA